ncbi:calcium-binding protein [Scytonema sp. NUACC26]|uniref:calcium-binding protein n=1 Tax=Scytonema sp. NUACC26 TaxID=3140176 RepID=UPI0038B33D29
MNNVDNTLDGKAGNDELHGRDGNDELIGGQGSDTYNVDTAGDIVTENLNEGIDIVNAAINYTLAANLENLNLLEGTAALNGTGNELNNTINGNSTNNTLNGGAGDDRLYGFAGGDTLQGGDGNDWIVGGQGNDILTGGTGNDYFACNAITDAGDRITDFTVGSDKIVLTDLLKNLGYKGSNAIADGVLSFKQASSSLALVQIDPDGTASNLFRAAPFMLLDNVLVTALNNSNNFVF